MPRKTKEPTFAEARERLDTILEELERDSADVDMLAARIREASELIRFCRERLATTRQEVQKVVAELSDEPVEPAEPEADSPAAAETVSEPDGPEPEPPLDLHETGDLPF
jgi:exodeoxyribonuclease VII small subunit